MIEEVYGYKWMNENGARSAEQIAKQFYGLPTAPENVTTESFEAVKNEGSEGVFWYYIGTLEPLGGAKFFNINVNIDPEI